MFRAMGGFNFNLTASSFKAYYYGDSVTFGTNASAPTNRWTSVFSRMTGVTENNFGVGGSTLEKQSPINPLGATNMVDRAGTVPTKGIGDSFIVFSFGINDWGVTAPNYTPANFMSDYRLVLNDALSKGWTAANIIIVGPAYVTDTAFTFYNGLNGGNTPTRANLLAFVQAAGNIALEYGTRYVNPYNIMEGTTNISSYLSATDGVHPNDAGYALIADIVYRQLFVKSAPRDFNNDFNGDFQ